MVGLTSTLVHCVVRILATIAIAALLYLCFKGARKIFKSGDRTPQGISSGNPEARLARKLHSKTRLIRGLSFQDGSAHTYAAKYYSYEYGEDEGREMAQPPTFDRLYSHDDNADFNIDYTF